MSVTPIARTNLFSNLLADVKILLICPQYPDTFWSFKHALRFICKRIGQPPLGLVTGASLLPGEWEKRLIDLTLTGFATKDLRWADYVFLGGMSVQTKSAREVIARCNEVGTKVAAAGPLFTARHEELTVGDHFIKEGGSVVLKDIFPTTRVISLGLPANERVDTLEKAAANLFGGFSVMGCDNVCQPVR